MKIDRETLRKIREEKGYSLRELAELSGVDYTSLYRWETLDTARPFPKNVKKVANALGIEISDLAIDNQADVANEEIITLDTTHATECHTVDYIVNNKLTNLIALTNPGLQTESGIRAAILYRVCPTNEVDSAHIVREAYQKVYGNDIPESGDTIFNAFIPFLDFCRAKLKGSGIKIPGNQKELLLLVYISLDRIFDGYDDLRGLFDRYFDLMYSFSNLMPVPKFFNGTKSTKGKGTWNLNKDYPKIYYQNLQDINSDIYKREEMKAWLDGVMEKYRIGDMYQLEPPYDIEEYYGFDDRKLGDLKKFIKHAIRLIEDRFRDE